MISPRRYNAALVFAMMAHRDQTDYGGFPYITHPINVAETVMRQGASEEAVTAALLHDTVEDTDVTLLEIDESFGSRVAELVAYVTREGHESYAGFIERIVRSGDEEASIIKLADIKDNTRPDRRTGRSKEPGLIERYAKAQARLEAVVP